MSCNTSDPLLAGRDGDYWVPGVGIAELGPGSWGLEGLDLGRLGALTIWVLEGHFRY